MKVLLWAYIGFALSVSPLSSKTFILYDKHDPVSQNIVDALNAVKDQNIGKSQAKDVTIVSDTRIIEQSFHNFKTHILLGIGPFGEHFINKNVHKIDKWDLYYMPLQTLNLSDTSWHHIVGMFLPQYRQGEKLITREIDKHPLDKNKLVWLTGLPALLDKDDALKSHSHYRQYLPQQPVCIIIISDKIGQIGNLKMHLTTGDLRKFAESIDSQFKSLPIVIFEEHSFGSQQIKRRNKTIVTRQYVNPLTIDLMKYLKALRKNDKSSVSYIIRENDVDPQLALYHHLENFPDSVLLLPDTMHKMTHELYRFGYTKNKKIIVYSANDKQGVSTQHHHNLAAQGFHKLWWKTNSITQGIQLPLGHVPVDSSKDVIKVLADRSAHKTT